MDDLPRPGRWWMLAAFVALTLLLGFLAGLATQPKIPTWYASLQKPWFNPPPFVFAPVWTILYVIIAWAGWRIWEKPASAARTRALWVYAVQLALNLAWSPAFFTAESPLLGMVVVIPLWLSVLANILAFRPLDRAAALSLLPYLAWVSFAALLNGAILALN
ncbi:TspO/MBR family protein [Prosthecomicrobium sp. N25]|uniref:TspO/MBR family protein n=1 Tax=Prosthecomicrobium sp. N25 TaxID=3129254 RepID=UPI003077329C